MEKNDDWDDLLITQDTKAFRPVKTSNKTGKKRKSTPGTIIMAVAAIISISAAIIFTVIFTVKKIELAKLEDKFTSIHEPFSALVEEKSEAGSELQKIKTDTDNLQKQIDNMRG